ncbi:hypothetical protein ACOME3_005912 [Neoechinorhynchus agilis]
MSRCLRFRRSYSGYKTVAFATNPELGKGGFARVYLMQNGSGVRVAIKTVDKSRLTSRGHVRRLRQEVQIQQNLEHKNIVKLLDFFEDRNCVYLVLECCEIGTLGEFIRRNHPLGPSQVKSIFFQSASAVQYLHNALITHRDVSLGNLLLSTSKSDELIVKLSDFGLAKSLANNSEDASDREDELISGRPVEQTLCGTPNFIAPENMMGRHEQGLYGDIWSLGCVLYALITGKPPFEGDNCAATMNRVASGKFSFSNETVLRYPLACELIGQMLRIGPNDRIRVDEILRHPFLRSKSIFPRMSSNKSDSGIVRSTEGSLCSHQNKCCDHYSSCSEINSLYLSNMSLMSSTSQTRDGLECMPNTRRLRPIRVRINNVMMTLNKAGEIVMEFLVEGSDDDQIAITGVMRISPDGEKIKVYNPNMLMLSSDNSSALTYLEYSRQTLPSSNWKQYKMASKFVNRIRSRTQKIKLFTDEAKCVLFESSPDFEVLYKSGHKLTVTGTSASLSCPNQPDIQINWHRFDESCFSQAIKRLLLLGKNLHNFCLQQETHFEKYFSESSWKDCGLCFPVVLGRPPTWDK